MVFTASPARGRVSSLCGVVVHEPDRDPQAQEHIREREAGEQPRRRIRQVVRTQDLPKHCAAPRRPSGLSR